MKKYISILMVVLLALSSCTDFLTRDPKDTVTDTSDFWNSEDNIRTSLYGFYTTYFPGYRSDWERADWYSETDVADWTDDNAQEAATFFTKVAPATDTDNWSFTNVRSINTIINRVGASNLSTEAKNHWLGVARLFRAMEYSSLVSKFGDVPWYSNALTNTDYESLYKARDSRTMVMDNVLNDFQFACQNIRATDGTKGLSVNKDVAYAYMSRCMLFEGTWQKYREKNTEYAAKYLQAAKDAAQFIMTEGKYKLCDDYKALTTSLDLAGNSEIIMYRSYVSGIVTHSLMSFQNTEIEINSPSKSLVDSYLTTKGLPVGQDASYSDKWYADEMANRDPRLGMILDSDTLRLKGVVSVYATSGYFGTRFVNPSILNSADGRSNTCVTDAPVMKYNEVLMNYIESSAELAQLGKYTLTQSDFDKTINLIRDRKSTAMPHVTLAGANLSVNGTTIDDPARDSDVPSVIWEIRRERRTELAYEGIRFNDLRRWSKLNYADMSKNAKLNCGAWLDKDKYVAWYNVKHPNNQITLETLKSITLDRDGNAGYIKPISNSALLRTYSDKDYLYPIPVNQISLYETKGYKLTQNPGW